jgi:outer membrane protein TolC
LHVYVFPVRDETGAGMMVGKTGETAGRRNSGGIASSVGPALMMVIVAASAAQADTLDGALVNAYQNNPQLNSQRLRQAQSNTSAAREALRDTEQTILLNAATAYMDLLRDGALIEIQRSNVEVLQEQLRQTRNRFNVGEVLRTDVAQTEAQLAQGRTTELSAESQCARSLANYRQSIGIEPGTLEPGAPVDRLSPETLVEAIKIARARHPSVGQKRKDLDAARDQVQAGVRTAWGQLEAAKAQILSTQAQVASSEIALNGIREEARVGMRTTYDILVAQQQLVNARTALVTAQHGRVVASFTLLSAVGDLNLPKLGLNARTRVERLEQSAIQEKCVTPEPE